MNRHAFSSFRWILAILLILAIMVSCAPAIDDSKDNSIGGTSAEDSIDAAGSLVDIPNETGEIKENIEEKRNPGMYDGETFIAWHDLLDTGAIRVIDGAVSIGAILPDVLPEKNDYGFFYGVEYSIIGGAFVFNENTSVEVYTDGVLDETIPAGVVQFGQRTIDMSAIGLPVGVVSDDGYSIDFFEANTTFFLGVQYVPSGDLVLPNDGTIDTIGNNSFSYCPGLTSIDIPDGVASIGDSAFSGCSGLTSITIPDSVASIGDSAFSGCSGLTRITIPDSVTSISSYAFAYCSGLTSITIPSSVTTIESATFIGCSRLTSVAIPDSVTTIGVWAFSDCTGLTSATIGNSVTTIGMMAFSHCETLTAITMPNSVTTIETMAFSDCTNLTTVTIAAEIPPVLGHSVFGSCAQLKTIKVPSAAIDAYKAAWSAYASTLVAIR